MFDPWETALEEMVGDQNGKILCEAVWNLLGMFDPGRRTQEQNARVGAVMKSLKFERKKARHDGKPRWHYIRGGSAEEREMEIITKDGGDAVGM